MIGDPTPHDCLVLHVKMMIILPAEWIDVMRETHGDHHRPSHRATMNRLLVRLLVHGVIDMFLLVPLIVVRNHHRRRLVTIGLSHINPARIPVLVHLRKTTLKDRKTFLRGQDEIQLGAEAGVLPRHKLTQLLLANPARRVNLLLSANLLPGHQIARCDPPNTKISHKLDFPPVWRRHSLHKLILLASIPSV